MKRIFSFLFCLTFSIVMSAQMSGGEITRLNKEYYGRSAKTMKSGAANKTKEYSGEECYDKGMSEFMNSNQTKAFDWFMKGASKSDGPCELMCGMYYEGGVFISQDLYKAVEYYRKAANRGVVRAQFHLGKCYYDGIGVSVDYNQALSWLERAAGKNDSDALAYIGNYYNDGLADTPNYYLAAHYYELSANAGNPNGKMMLGYKYLYGEGKQQDSEKALLLMQEAAEQGIVDAMDVVGMMYSMGKFGITPNREKAIYWLQKAADAGSEEAKTFLPIVRENLH